MEDKMHFTGQNLAASVRSKFGVALGDCGHTQVHAERL